MPVLESTMLLPIMCDDCARNKAVHQVADTMCDAMTQHSYLKRKKMHQGRAPWTEKGSLHKILTMYWGLRIRDWILTLYLLASELKGLDRSVQCLSLAAIRNHIWGRHIWCHIKKHGVVRRHVTHVAQNTCYEQSVIQDWVSYVNHNIKICNYKACDVVNIDKTNVDFDLASGTTLAGCDE
jgi:hypothetical protein